MRTDTYILNDQNEVIPADNTIQWAEWLGDNRDRKRVGSEHIGKYWVSTVFLGIDHGLGDQPRTMADGSQRYFPTVFETMVFVDRSEVHLERCCTWEQAVRQHEAICKAVRTGEIK